MNGSANGSANGAGGSAGSGGSADRPGGSADKADGPGKPSGEPAGRAHAHGSTRRPPQVTQDTARPEGGGRAAPGGAPAPARQWPLLAVLGATGLGLLIVAFDAFRVGALIIGLALIGGAVLRWTLPSVGMLAVRSRFTDLFVYGGLGLAIVLLALMAQPHAWLKIPFLEDMLHFTVQ
ncbi:DUF3017 domain-containing protein [Streptomyces hesseae]|uniref:DUF3017 domain-containing protein n=1 Tax=Streptomyces hesseae TaxID=3075519 RepID=A0ABU2SRL9_9ACTN|nr:DUF3017 domain-containing protein [Streptomyces sp. DSM 40473]MDT0450665.1 DUF3017 domain-containing protein [Streptomyces sp. DSM 40473]